jgi:ATP-dependent exoDNAse (exonuclease V) beta subunit
VSSGASAPPAAGPVLTDEQEHPVARRAEPLLLSAGAGSGKTSVLVERFVRAVREDGIAPGRILAITFTDRAAGELRERVRARFLELGEREAARDTEAAFVGTFHGFCARLLRAHPLLAELDPDFAILEEGMAGRLRGRAFSTALRLFLGREDRAGAVDLLGAYGVDRVHAMIAAVHAQLRSRGQRVPSLPEPIVIEGATDADQNAEAAAACALLDELLGGFSCAYEELKRERSAVDFDDLELFARDLLERHETVRAAWAERFELLMVDEFQDTNPRQLAILRALERGNLFTVGDEFQSIYGFRHADVSLFRARRQELAPSGASLALTRNFRSRAPLLEVVNAVFEERFVEFAPLLAGRATESPDAGGASTAQARSPGPSEPLTELLLTDRCGWEEDGELAREIAAGLPSAPLWRQAEACMLAQRVAELVQSGRARAGEVVVLLRALGDLDVYERALQQRGLRTLAAVGAFWEHQQVGDLLAYLRTLANPLDELALYSTLASPLVGVSRDGLALLAVAARADGRGAWETALRVESEDLLAGEISLEDRGAIVGFCERLRGERERASRRTISELVERAIEHSGYELHALGLEWGERRLANLHKLLRLARRFEASEGRDLRAFLDHVAYLIGASSAAESDAPVDGAEPDAVRLMSIHAAKGLEFPVVCVADLGRAPNTRLADLLVEGSRIGLQLVRLDGGKATATLDYEQLAEERRAAEAAEEDRILYVAMTRARERLILSAAVDLQRWPEARQGSTAISWLGPALAAELPTLAQSAGAEWELAVGPLAAPIGVRLNTPATATAVLHPSLSRSGGESDASRELAPESQPEPAIAATDALSEQAPRGSARVRAEATLERISTLSYTSLTELQRCGYRYYLERVLGVPEDRAAARAPGFAHGLRARERGILVHRLLESFDFARPVVPSPVAVESLAHELGIGLEIGDSARIAELLETAVRSAPARRIAAAREVRREHPFAFSLGAGEPLVTGAIDLLAREQDGGWVVLDYKSDRVRPEVDLAGLVEREYGVQRLLYALAVLRKGAPRVEIVHWFLERPDDWVGASYAVGERGALEAGLAQRLTRARERGFAVAEAPHRGLCLTCPGRASLCSWGEERTMRELPLEGGPPPEGR